MEDKLKKEEQKIKFQEDKLKQKRKELNKKKKEIQRRKNNLRLFPIYRIFSWDFLFYYPIILLFLTKVKNLSASEAVFFDTIFMFSSSTFQILVAYFETKTGKANLLNIGNFLMILSLVGLIFFNNKLLIFSTQIISGLAMAIKNMCEPNMLYESIKSSKKRGTIYSKIDSKAMSNFFYFEALASVLSGFAFSYNPYLPIFLSLLCTIIAFVLSIRFKDIAIIEEKEKIKLEKFKNENVSKYILNKEVRKKRNIPFSKYIKGLKSIIKHFIKSKRLHYLFILTALIYSIIYGTTSLRSNLLVEINISANLIGIIFATLEIIAGITSKYQEKLHKMFRNRVLTVLAIPTALSAIILGFVANDSFAISKYIFVYIMIAIPYIVKGPFLGLTQRYLSNFTNSKIRNQITSFKNIASNLTATIVSFMCAFLLDFTNSGNVFIVIGSIISILTLLTLDKMRSCVGLKPEFYSDIDIKYAHDYEKIVEKRNLTKYSQNGITVQTTK